jgi:preprotein translocase subunit SecE
MALVLALAPDLELRSLVSVIIVLVVVGLVWWLIDTQLPLAPPIKLVIRVIIILAVCLWLLRWGGLL